jgi:signal transduction histidine kinase
MCQAGAGRGPLSEHQEPPAAKAAEADHQEATSLRRNGRVHERQDRNGATQMDGKGRAYDRDTGDGDHPFGYLSGLQARMTFSYVWVTVVSVLVLEALVVTLLGVVLFSFLRTQVLPAATAEIARDYALAAGGRANGEALDPRATFEPGKPGSLVPPGDDPNRGAFGLPYRSTLAQVRSTVEFGLLIGPDGHIVASSYPPRYPSGPPVSAALPNQVQLVNQALRGVSATTTVTTPDGPAVSSVAPVWSRDGHPIGAVYVQIPASLPPPLSPLFQLLPISGLILLVIVTPIGGLFGMMTTRGVVRRIRHLVGATTRFADGDYTQRVPVTRLDEVGQLEHYFNRMAEQLVESIAQRQELVERNARLAERSRISRELHDAISQDLFSLRMLGGGLRTAIAAGSDLQPYIETLEQSTDSMTREMRALLLELRPSQLEQLGLPAALEELAMAYSTRLGITVTADVAPVALDAPIEHALLRIAQEALANAVRHGDARTVTLSLRPVGDRVELLIADDGKGFEPAETATQHGLGLRLMDERVHELHGAMSLESAPGHGTRIQVRLPRLEQEHEHD